MNEVVKVVLTASVTLLGGVVLVVVGQAITRFVVDPLLDFRRSNHHQPSNRVAARLTIKTIDR